MVHARRELGSHTSSPDCKQRKMGDLPVHRRSDSRPCTVPSFSFNPFAASFVPGAPDARGKAGGTVGPNQLSNMPGEVRRPQHVLISSTITVFMGV